MGWLHDTFTEAVNTLLTAHTSESGHTWVHWAGDTTSPGIYPALGGGVVGSGAGSTQVFRTSAMAADADGDLRALCNYQATFSSIGICRRLNNTGDGGYLAAYLPSTSKWYIFRIGAALATTQLAVSASTYSYVANDTPDITFDVQGTGAAVTLSLTVNGSVVCSGTDTSGSRVTANGYDGLWFSTPTAPATGMFFGEVWGNEAVASTSYTITTPVARQQHRLSGVTTGNATVNLTGTYTGTAPNRWRVVQDGTSTPVTGLDWQAFSTAPSGGAFSQTITLPKQSGFVNIVVGHTTDPATATSGKVGTGPIIVWDGQSWAWLPFSGTAYAGDSSLTPDARLTITGKQASGAWLTPSSATMNAVIAAGNALIAALGCPVAFVDGSWDASGLTVPGGSGASGPNGRWISGGAAGNAYTSSAAAVAAAGGADGTIWMQGQVDAGASVTQSAHYTALGQMTALRRAIYGATHPYIIVTHPRHLAGLTDAQVEAIRKAHVQACGDPYNYRVDALDIPLHTDNVHPTAAGFTTLGARCAQAVLAALGAASYYRGPRLTSVTQVSSTVYDLNLTPNSAGTNFTPTSAITGIRALVAGAPVSVSSWVQQNASTIRATLASAPASMPTFDIGYGASPTITSFVKDNTPLALPLEYNSGVLASAADGTAPTLTGSITASSITRTTYTLTWPAGSDNVAVVGYDYSLDGGGSWTSLGNVLSVGITGRTAGSTDSVRVRDRDAAGNVSTPSLSLSVTLAPPPTLTTESFRDYLGALIAPSTVIPGVEVLDPSQPPGSRSVLSLSNVALDASSQLVISSTSLADGTDYLVVAFDSTGATRGAKVCTAG